MQINKSIYLCRSCKTHLQYVNFLCKSVEFLFKYFHFLIYVSRNSRKLFLLKVIVEKKIILLLKITF